jgi:hypothetical protein
MDSVFTIHTLNFTELSRVQTCGRAQNIRNKREEWSGRLLKL